MTKLKSLFSPYPADVTISVQELHGFAGAIEALMSEVSWVVCTTSSCGCPSSKKYEWAKKTRDRLVAIIDSAVATQPIKGATRK